MKRRMSIFLCLVLLLSAVALPQAVLAGPTDPAKNIIIATNAVAGNKNGVGDLGGTYSFEDGILTLNEFKSAFPITWEDGSLEIILVGDCVVAGIYGMWEECGILSISGEGSLTVNAETGNAMGLCGLIVDSVALTAISVDAAGIYAYESDITLMSGSITATTAGKAPAIVADNIGDGGGKITVLDGVITATNTGDGGEGNADAIYAYDIALTDAQVTAAGADHGIYCINDLSITDSIVEVSAAKYRAVYSTTMSVSGNSDITAIGMDVGIMTTAMTVRDNPRIIAKARADEASEPSGMGIWMLGTCILDIDLSAGGIITATGVKATFGETNFGGGIVFEEPSDVTLGAKTKVADEQVLIDGGVEDMFVQAYGKDGAAAEETILYAAMTIKATAGAGGSITPAGEKEVIPRRDYTYTMTPNEGYQVKDVLVDGQSVGAWLEYTFTDVNADHTIEVVFEEVVVQTITISGPATVKVGETFTLTVSQQGGDWEYDEAYLSYKDGVFTALKAGETTITYKGDGVVGTHVLTITDKTPAPYTGDDLNAMVVPITMMLWAALIALQTRKRIRQL